MADYIICRNTARGKAAQVTIFFAPVGVKPATHIRRIEKISSFKFVGMLTNDREDLDRITEAGAVSDTVILKRTGIDLTGMVI